MSGPSRYLEMVRAQRNQKQGSGGCTAKALLRVLAVVAMAGSGIYWWGIQSMLTPHTMIAVAFTAIMVLAPPCLMSFLIPWSPAGMLLQKINARTWGYMVVIASSMILVYYSYSIQYQWWAAQQVVADSGIVLQQVLIGLIGFIFIPALLWTPVSGDELIEQVRQAHLVRRYEIQTQADIAILRNTLMHAQQMALIGFANLNVQEKEELASIMRGLVKGISQTMEEFAESVHKVSGATIPFSSLEDNDTVREYLDYVAEAIRDQPVTAVQKKPQGNTSSQNQSQNALARNDSSSSSSGSRNDNRDRGSQNQSNNNQQSRSDRHESRNEQTDIFNTPNRSR